MLYTVNVVNNRQQKKAVRKNICKTEIVVAGLKGERWVGEETGRQIDTEVKVHNTEHQCPLF